MACGIWCVAQPKRSDLLVRACTASVGWRTAARSLRCNRRNVSVREPSDRQIERVESVVSPESARRFLRVGAIGRAL